ncbi:AAA family ATPase [Haladaptatus sp. AB643]|uniref:AAA family ATPase n=1 Tax=Haladaptatus sp. AB643 TaxID=2934174 RepID=UPI00209BD9FF|nr:AAA family ATPase [Haladaptatus sp. AB643]MCO8242596.1 AAA family ATPase [Haladaptatus sp. AB643]
MTGTVLAVASGKGGVGKTTTAINLGAMLAAAEYSVVVVDTDLGMANVGGYLDFEIDGATLHEVLSGDAGIEDAIYNAPGEIDVVPSSTDIYTFAQSQTAGLQQVVADLREQYEYVLLDTGAGISYDTILPLSLADDVLLVTTPDIAAVRDTAKTAELTARVDGSVRGAVLTQRGNDILNADNVEGTLDNDVLTVVPDDETVPMGLDAGRPLAVFSPNSPSAKAYRELADIVTGATDSPELSGEPTSRSNSTPVSDSPPSPSLADAEFELGASAPEEPPVTEPEPTPEATDDTPSEESDASPSPDERPLDLEAADAFESANVSSVPTDSPSDSVPSDQPTEDAETESDSASNPNPVHDLIDRKVIKTGDTDGSEPSVEAAPLEDEPESVESAATPDIPTGDADLPTDDAAAPEQTVDTATPPGESIAEADDTDDFDTVLPDVGDTSESTTTPDTETPTDLPDEIVEAEPEERNDADEIEAVPFQDEPVRPELDDDDTDGDDDVDSDEETDGLFGRIGSLFR